MNKNFISGTPKLITIEIYSGVFNDYSYNGTISFTPTDPTADGSTNNLAIWGGSGQVFLTLYSVANTGDRSVMIEFTLHDDNGDPVNYVTMYPDLWFDVNATIEPWVSCYDADLYNIKTAYYPSGLAQCSVFVALPGNNDVMPTNCLPTSCGTLEKCPSGDYIRRCDNWSGESAVPKNTGIVVSLDVPGMGYVIKATGVQDIGPCPMCQPYWLHMKTDQITPPSIDRHTTNAIDFSDGFMKAINGQTKDYQITCGDSRVKCDQSRPIPDGIEGGSPGRHYWRFASQSISTTAVALDYANVQ
jgi:hypothetical protein